MHRDLVSTPKASGIFTSIMFALSQKTIKNGNKMRYVLMNFGIFKQFSVNIACDINNDKGIFIVYIVYEF